MAIETGCHCAPTILKVRKEGGWGGAVIGGVARLKLWSRWCILIWGRALIRTWALIQGNMVSHLGKNFLNE